MLKLAGAIRITSGKFGAMDTERGHEGVARIKNAGLPVREWTPFGADRSRFNLDQTDARARSSK
ncbi:MAG: hypothetical protein WCC08_00615 [Terrimicrobiaceae bacterium]